jgi:DNA-directed RNA polymerase specialized sigma24 family protein
MENSGAYATEQLREILQALLKDFSEKTPAELLLESFLPAFAALPQPMQQAVYLRYYSRYTLAEVGRAMHINGNKVTQLLQQSRARLRRGLLPDYYRQPLVQFFRETEHETVIIFTSSPLPNF